MKEVKLWCLGAWALLLVSCSATEIRQVNAPPAPSSTQRYESRPRRTSPLPTFSGRVVGIDDGDSIIVLDVDNRSHKIRLQGIDAPEGGQAFGDRSRQSLSDLVFSKDITIEWFKRERYGRLVGKVLVDGRDVCLDQIKAGMAWHYKYFQSEQTAEDRRLYADAEVEARASRVGLWADANPIPPWNFRRGR
ncbi:MAG TPA: thermonuclease family protein [Pyrinomonadaceae bacterium]|nr:thermonuclease family protein [Pyrinomonadaceae bacterium]